MSNIPSEIKDMLDFGADKDDFQKQLDCITSEFKQYYRKNFSETRQNANEFDSESPGRAELEEDRRCARLMKWKTEQLAWRVLEYEFRKKKNWRPLLNILSAYFRLYYLKKAVKKYDFSQTRDSYRDEISEMERLIRMATAELEELKKLEENKNASAK